MSFFSEAGLVADSPQAGEALLAESVRIVGREGGIFYLRHRGKSPVYWLAKTNKVTLECDVFADADANFSISPPK
jgi:hypothetical protein